MLRLCALLVSCSVAMGHIEPWPFQVVDQLVTEFQSSNQNLEKLSQETRQEASWNFHEKPTKLETEFDFIVIGGGSSGAVVANRLSEVPEWKVLLLEAGGEEDDVTRVPRNWEKVQATPFNWQFFTTPQNFSCQAMEGHKCVVPAGRILGGTSSINSMVYTRGNQRDYDIWADQGNKGWCWGDVLPFFKKLEDAHFEHFDHKLHHQGGLQYLENPQFLTPLADHAIAAGKELGLPLVDYNGKHQIGVAIPQLTTKCGRRQSTAESYLKTAIKRPNLIVKPHSSVTKILISPHTKDVKGVEFLHDGKLFFAKAEKEVILSAGAVNTPKILILSGIGPKEDCERVKVDHLVDLKVGKNLKIRPTFIGLDYVLNDLKTDDHQDAMSYLRDGKGPLAAPGIEALAYFKTKVSKETADYPDVEVQFMRQHYGEANLKGLVEKQYESIYKPLEGKQGVKLGVTLNHPKSSGFLTVVDGNPLRTPVIEPNFFEHEFDFETLLHGIFDAAKLSHTEAFKKLGAAVNHNRVHGCEDVEFGTEAYWKCAMKFLVVASGDVTGSARMGPEDDHEAVVDNKLRVYGVHKLRVADASVIPVPITGNTVGPSIMIGEMAAHLITEDWK